MAKAFKAPREPKPSKPLDPDKAVLKPPRLRPTTTRNYGKSGTVLSGAPDQGLRGAGIGYGALPGGKYGI